jgi:polysaccharide pyruvyl transferase WcaK-like protein
MARPFARLMLTSESLPYIGWQGNGNLGDEAVFEGYRYAFRMNLVPISYMRWTPWVLKTFKPTFDSVFLGGGTLIGRIYVRQLLEQFAAESDVPEIVNLGTGVVDPSFAGLTKQQYSDELRKWAELLGGSRVSVRGPHSARLLAEVGLRAQPVGDPALLIPVESAPPDDVTRVGINAGITSRMWGDPGRLLDELEKFAQICLARGWELRLYSVWKRDLPYMRALAKRVGLDRSNLEFIPFSARDFVRSVQTCGAFVGMKLHSVVLSTSAAVPSVMLAYDPKCDDFQESISRNDFSIRTDELTSRGLFTLIEQLLDEREFHSQAVRREVQHLRSQLLSYAASFSF